MAGEVGVAGGSVQAGAGGAGVGAVAAIWASVAEGAGAGEGVGAVLAGAAVGAGVGGAVVGVALAPAPRKTRPAFANGAAATQVPALAACSRGWGSATPNRNMEGVSNAELCQGGGQ